MNKEKQKLDYTALAIFFPAVVALAIVPLITRATMVALKITDTYRLFGGVEDTSAESGGIYLADMYAQGKGFAIVLIALIMLGMALVCCMFLFRHAEKRSLVYMGASAVFVLMSLISALSSQYGGIALWGGHNSSEGFFTTACYFVMFLFTMYAFRKTQNFNYVLIGLAISVGVNFILSLFQFFGNDLVNYDWFRSFAIDPAYEEMLVFSPDMTLQGTVHGALQSYNYVGSFTGMVIPLFAVMAVNGKGVLSKVLFALVDAMALFMLFAANARTGIIAVIAALIVAAVVFARVLVRRWKAAAAVAVCSAVVIVGANFVMDNRVFASFGSLGSDIADLFQPADQTDILADLPVREIKHNADGGITLVTQDNELTIRFDTENKEYIYTDINGDTVEVENGSLGTVAFKDADYAGISLEVEAADGNPDYGNTLYLWFNWDDTNYLTFYLSNNKLIHLVEPVFEDKTEAVNAPYVGFQGKETLWSNRGYVWSRITPMLSHCLVTGYGPDTFAYVFPQNDYLTKYAVYGDFYETVAQPQNMYLQMFLSNGLIAVIAFAAVCGLYIFDCFRLYALKKQYRMEQIFGISVMLAVIGYLAAGIFTDSSVSVTPVFWILLGVGVALNTINRRMDKNESVDVDEFTAVKTKKAVSDEKMKSYEERAQDINRRIDEDRERARELKQKLLEAEKRAAEEKKKKAERVITADDTKQLLDRVTKLVAEKSAELEAESDSDTETDEK